MAEITQRNPNTPYLRSLATAIGVGATALVLSGCGGNNTYVARVHCPDETTPALAKVGPTTLTNTYEHDGETKTTVSDAIGVEITCRDEKGQRFKPEGLEPLTNNAQDQIGVLVIKASRYNKEDYVKRHMIIQNDRTMTLHFGSADEVSAKIGGQLPVLTFPVA